MADLGKAYVQIVPSAKGISGSISKLLGGEASAAGKSAGLSIAGGIGAAVKTASVAITAVTGASVAFAKSAVDAGMNFDSAMSQVAATMGKSVDDIQNLRDFAQEMGSTTAFSASEAADALNFMALAGYDAEKSMRMLPNVLNLAAAGGMELGAASDMITDSQTALGLSLEDTEKLVDQMALTSSKTNTSVSQLGDAILSIGGNAKLLSGGTTELNQVLGLMADNGIKGAEAGTHLRNMILSLTAPTDKAKKALKELGISVTDAEGNMKPMEDIMANFNEALDGMGADEKTQWINSIFNKTDLIAVNALLDTDAKRWAEVNDAIEDAEGAASKMADTQLDNLSGDITLFKSALEGAQIALSDKLTPNLREFVQFGADGLSKLTGAFKNGGLNDAMAVAGQLLGDLVTQLMAKLPEMVQVGISLLSTLGQALVDNMPLIINSVIQVVMLLSSYFIDNIDTFIDVAIEIILALANGLIEAIPQIAEKVPTIITKLVDAFVENLPLLANAALQIMIALGEGIVMNIPVIMESMPKVLQAIWDAIKEFGPKLWEAGKEIVNGLWQGIKDNWSGMVDKIKGLGSDMIDSVKGVFGIHSPSKVFANIGEMCGAGLEEGLDTMPKVLQAAETDLQKSMDGFELETNAKVNASLAPVSGAVSVPAQNNNSEQIAAAVAEALQNIGIDARIELEPNTSKFFSSMRSEANIYKRRTGEEAFA